MYKLTYVRRLIKRISLEILGIKFKVEAHVDKVYGGSIYLQVLYTAPCTKTGEVQEWKSGKNYLSQFMTEDEIIKKAYITFEQTVKHEIMEGFKVDNIVLFNPHVNFECLLEISNNKITRK